MGGIITSVDFPSAVNMMNNNQQRRDAITTTAILALQSPGNVKYHPELRKLRLLLTCEYGKPKFIKYLFRVTPITGEILLEHQLNVINFISKFEIMDDMPEPLNEDVFSSDLPIHLSVSNCLTNILILLGICHFSSFMKSTEGEDWIRYQHLLTEAHYPHNTYGERKSLSESTIALTRARSHEFVQGVTDNEIMALMNKPQWIVTLARTLDALPFPVSIHRVETLYQMGNTSHRYPLLYANYYFLEMTGYSNQKLAGCDFDFLEKSNELQSPGFQLITNSFHSGTKLRIGRVHYRANGEPFHNYLTFQPLHDMNNSYKFMIIVHCDITAKGNDSHYLHKVNLFAETMLPTCIYCTENESSCLLSYFANHDIFNETP